MKTKRKPVYWRAGGAAGFVAVAAIVVAAAGTASPSHAAAVGKRTGAATPATTTTQSTTDLGSTTTQLQQWAACERSHGDPDQADPTVLHQAIYIAVAPGALGNWNQQTDNGPCSGDLAAAERAAAGGRPVSGWGEKALYVQYANCMRANGYPTFPYPSGIEPDGHLSSNFNGTGIDPNSPAFLSGHANQTCGQQIGAPAWWINNWGPPGSVDAYPAGGTPNDPLGNPGPGTPRAVPMAVGKRTPGALPRATALAPAAVPVPAAQARPVPIRAAQARPVPIRAAQARPVPIRAAKARPVPVAAAQASRGANKAPLPVPAGA